MTDNQIMSESNGMILPDCEIIKHARLYGLSESVIASGYPMKTDNNRTVESVECFSYWNKHGKFISDFFKYTERYGKPKGEDTKSSCYFCGSGTGVQRNSKKDHYYCSKCNHQIERYGDVFETSPEFILHDDYVEIILIGEKRRKTAIKISYESLPKVFYANPASSGENRYARANGILLHRFIMNASSEDECVDHINRDIYDNRLCNLRICSKKDNSRNRASAPTNTSGISGVSWRADRNKWRAYINSDYKQIRLGYFDRKEDAILARLSAEKALYGEFSPQRALFKEYGIETGYDDDKAEDNNRYSLKDALNHYKRALKLFSTNIGGAHDQALSGIIVQFDLTLPVKVWTELQRYHFIDFVSSQSTMHRIAKFDLDSAYCDYTDVRIIGIMKELVQNYNDDPTAENYLRVLYSNPCGFKLTARMTTNYRQLKTIWKQRHNHRLPEWRIFCKWIEGLPYGKEWLASV